MAAHRSALVLVFASAVMLAAAPAMVTAQDAEVVATGVHAAPAAVTATASKTAASTAAPAPVDKDHTLAWLASASQPSLDDRAAAADPAPSGSARTHGFGEVHGTAGVSIGTGGYRSAYVSAVMPVGDNGMLGIAVSQTDYGRNALPYYGYGRRGYGFGTRGGSASDLSLSYMSSDDNDLSTPEGCAPGFRDDNGQYVEPLWVRRMNDGRSCDGGHQP